ncbi:hypothetical protein LR48_Vigan10g260700 [Vigna angularis]|uniref:Uncharacterized protein n=1 Tax=Phaseolus angularis TaxID=3914 RepID=A0A0L9VNT7_PHAAN|nr:hypothetical protein LR48_Vigan10g260700 [Vigna angularis]
MKDFCPLVDGKKLNFFNLQVELFGKGLSRLYCLVLGSVTVTDGNRNLFGVSVKELMELMRPYLSILVGKQQDTICKFFSSITGQTVDRVSNRVCHPEEGGSKPRNLTIGPIFRISLGEGSRTDQEVVKKGGSMEGRDNSWERRISEQKRELAEWRRNMQEMRQETRELLRVLGGRVWNQEKGLEGSPGPCRSGVAERSEAIEDKSSWRRTNGEVTRSEADRYNPSRSRVTERSEAKRYTPGRSRVAERSVGSEQEKTAGPNGRGLTKPNGLALQAANPRGLKEPNGRETNGKELSNPNVKGQEEPNDFTFTVKGRTVLHSKRSPSHWPNGLTVTFKGRTVLQSKQSLSNWPNGLTIRMKAKEGKVDGRINGRERGMDFVKRWTSEQKKGLAVQVTRMLEAYNSGKEVTRMLEAYNSGKEVTRMLEANKIQEEWKSLEEELPPPKPPDLSWRAVARGFHSYEYTMMKRSHEIKPPVSNLEDKVVRQRGVMTSAQAARPQELQSEVERTRNLTERFTQDKYRTVENNLNEYKGWSNDHLIQQLHYWPSGLTARSSLPHLPDSLLPATLPNARLPLLTSTRMIIAMTRQTYKNKGQHKENERAFTHPGGVVTGILISCHPRLVRSYVAHVTLWTKALLPFPRMTEEGKDLPFQFSRTDRPSGVLRRASFSCAEDTDRGRCSGGSLEREVLVRTTVLQHSTQKTSPSNPEFTHPATEHHSLPIAAATALGSSKVEVSRPCFVSAATHPGETEKLHSDGCHEGEGAPSIQYSVQQIQQIFTHPSMEWKHTRGNNGISSSLKRSSNIQDIVQSWCLRDQRRGVCRGKDEMESPLLSFAMVRGKEEEQHAPHTELTLSFGEKLGGRVHGEEPILPHSKNFISKILALLSKIPAP